MPAMTALVDPPSDSILDLLDAAFSQNYGQLASDGDNPGFISSMKIIRDHIIPAWRDDYQVKMTLNQATTIVAVIAAFETKLLDCYVGDRNQRRARIRQVDPTILDRITKARQWAKSPTFTLASGRTLTL